MVQFTVVVRGMVHGTEVQYKIWYNMVPLLHKSNNSTPEDCSRGGLLVIVSSGRLSVCNVR